MKIYLFLILLFACALLGAQEEKLNIKQIQENNYYQYDTDFLSPAFHQSRRDSLRRLMPDRSAAVFFSAPERNRSNDVYYEYHQDPNFYYLSGYMEPNSMLLIFKEPQWINGDSTDEIIFVQPRSPQHEVWTGRRLGEAGASAQLGIKQVAVNADFAGMKNPFSDLKRVFIQEPYAPEPKDTSETDNLYGLSAAIDRMVTEDQRKQSNLFSILMAQLRQVKTEEELQLLRKAINITCEAQNELMRNIDTSMKEYQTEAIIEYVFKKRGAEYPGFPSIQGSGENSCILHYTSNRRPLKNGGLLVSDVGAEYHGYTADVTRTIPPDGKFSKEEAIIYELVLKAQEAGIEAAKVGNSFWDPHKAAQAVIAEGLKKLKIIEKESEVGTYFMHGTSHYLGLDVHDAGLYTPLAENNVITVEPGIYIAEGSDCDPKWWNIGVRIEDDILITADGPENLSIASPRTIKDIEALMEKSGSLK